MTQVRYVYQAGVPDARGPPRQSPHQSPVAVCRSRSNQEETTPMKMPNPKLRFILGRMCLVTLALAMAMAPSLAFALAFSPVDVPGATETQAFSINDSDQIVGFFSDAGGTSHGFLLDNGVFTVIDPPGSTATIAFGINKRSQIVGAFSDAGGTTHGFLLTKGNFTLIDVPGATGGTQAT